MKNCFLIFSLIISVSVWSCHNKDKKEVNLYIRTISAKAWVNHENFSNDSVLYITLRKKTKNYIQYKVKFVKRPYEIVTELKNCFEAVDARTIFFNKCKDSSNDFKKLIKNKTLVLKKVSPKNSDESLEGSVYIFKNNSENELRIVDIFEYVNIRSEKMPNKAMTYEEEEFYYDEICNYFFKK